MSRRRIALLVLLLAAALPLGAWLVAAPMVASRTPATPEPPVDLEPPASGVRLVAAASGASALRGAAGAASAASGAADDGARCGLDQVAEYSTPEPDEDGAIHMPMPLIDPDGVIRRYPNETKAPGVGYTGALRRIDASLRATGDPFDQAVADGLNIGGLRSKEATFAAVVQDARQSHDPRVDGVAFSMCATAGLLDRSPGPSACQALNALDWARDDPGNGVPWLFALQQADLAGDRAAQREALRQLAAATRFDGPGLRASAAVARVHLAGEADLAGQADLAQRAVLMSLGTPVTPLTSRCRDKAGGDTTMAALCETIAGRMMDHTDSPMTMMIGASVHMQLTGDATRLDAIRREIHEAGERWSHHDEEPLCANIRRGIDHFVQVGRRGEVALMREEAKAVQPPREAASR